LILTEQHSAPLRTLYVQASKHNEEAFLHVIGNLKPGVQKILQKWILAEGQEWKGTVETSPSVNRHGHIPLNTTRSTLETKPRVTIPKGKPADQPERMKISTASTSRLPKPILKPSNKINIAAGYSRSIVAAKPAATIIPADDSVSVPFDDENSSNPSQVQSQADAKTTQSSHLELPMPSGSLVGKMWSALTNEPNNPNSQELGEQDHVIPNESPSDDLEEGENDLGDQFDTCHGEGYVDAKEEERTDRAPAPSPSPMRKPGMHEIDFKTPRRTDLSQLRKLHTQLIKPSSLRTATDHQDNNIDSLLASLSSMSLKVTKSSVSIVLALKVAQDASGNMSAADAARTFVSHRKEVANSIGEIARPLFQVN